MVNQMTTRILIAGPPCSGKTTLALELAAQHDATIADYDTIAQQLGSPDHYDHPAEIQQATLTEYERILAQPGNLIAIRCAPSRGARYATARRMHATRVIVLPVDADTCKQRALNDHRPTKTTEVIDWWWRTYQPTRHDTFGW
jgi:hypothetical protein